MRGTDVTKCRCRGAVLVLLAAAVLAPASGAFGGSAAERLKERRSDAPEADRSSWSEAIDQIERRKRILGVGTDTRGRGDASAPDRGGSEAKETPQEDPGPRRASPDRDPEQDARQTTETAAVREGAPTTFDPAAMPETALGRCVRAHDWSSARWTTCGTDPIPLTRREEVPGVLLGRPSAVVTAWNGAALGPKRLYFHGGGHNDYGGNEVIGFNYGSLKWDFRIPIDAVPEGRSESEFTPEEFAADQYPSGGPNAVHTYDGLVYSHETGEVFRFGGYGYWPTSSQKKHDYVASVFMFDPERSEAGWQKVADMPGGVTAYNVAVKTQVTSEGNIWVRGRDGERLFDPQTRSWTGDANSWGRFESQGSVGQAENGSVVWYADNKNMWVEIDGTRYEAASEWSEARPFCAKQGMAWHPLKDVLVVWCGQREIRTWDPATEKWTRYPNPGGSAPSIADSSGVFSKFHYLRDYNVFIGYNNVNQGVWFYRLPDKPPQDRKKTELGKIAAANADASTNHTINVHVKKGGRDINANGSVRVSYRKAGDTTWTDGLDLMRHDTGAFSGSVMGLEPGTVYEVRLQAVDPDGFVGDSSPENVLRVSTTPVSEPVSGGDEIRVTSPVELKDAVNRAEGGDVVLLDRGVYRGTLNIKASGRPEAPIVIRGAADGESVLDAQGGNKAVRIEGDYVHIERLTIQNADKGIALRDGRGDHTQGVVLRGNKIHRVRRGIDANEGHKDLTIVDNLLIGENAFGNTSRETWGDEGIVVTGQGIEVAYNTIAGFGDSLGLNKNTDLPNRAVTFHNNKVLWGGDDGIELDFADRNVHAYDNLLMNTANGLSFQFVRHGPAYAYRNVIYNTERGPYKIKPEAQTNQGVRLFNNTSIKSGEAWKDFSGRPLNTRVINNLFVGDGQTADTLRADTTKYRNVVLDYNAWSHDGRFQVGNVGSFSNFRAWQAGPQGNNDVLLEGEQIFADLPLEQAIAPFSEYRRRKGQDFTLAPGSRAIDAGTVIPGVTDGFTGPAPDIGAVEAGKGPPTYGTRLKFEVAPKTDGEQFGMIEPPPALVDSRSNGDSGKHCFGCRAVSILSFENRLISNHSPQNKKIPIRKKVESSLKSQFAKPGIKGGSGRPANFRGVSICVKSFEAFSSPDDPGNCAVFDRGTVLNGSIAAQKGSPPAYAGREGAMPLRDEADREESENPGIGSDAQGGPANGSDSSFVLAASSVSAARWPVTVGQAGPAAGPPSPYTTDRGAHANGATDHLTVLNGRGLTEPLADNSAPVDVFRQRRGNVHGVHATTKDGLVSEVVVPGIELTTGGLHDLGGAGYTGAIDGKGAVVTKADPMTLEDVRCRGIRVPGGNGACVRMQNRHLVIDGLRVRDSQSGVLANDQALSLTINNVDIANVGGECSIKCGRAHGVYMNTVEPGSSLTIRGGAIKTGKDQGHLVKTGAAKTLLVDLTLDERNGNQSRAIDAYNGGTLVLRNVTIHAKARDGNAEVIGWDYGERVHHETDRIVFDNVTIYCAKGSRLLGYRAGNKPALTGIETVRWPEGACW